MVDVGLVVVNEIPLGTLLSLSVNIPEELCRHRSLGLLLHLYIEILNKSRVGLDSVVDLEFAYVHLIVVVSTLNAETDGLDDVAL